MLVQDKVTGKWYDPQEEFEKIMQDPEIVAVLERLKNHGEPMVLDCFLT